MNKCQKLHDYLETVLGPTIAKYLQKINGVDDAPIESPIENNLNNSNETLTTVEDIISTTDKNIINETINNLNSFDFTTKAQFDPEFDWVPPENYSQDIAHNVDEELSKKGYDSTDDENIGFKLLNDSMITGILFDALFKSEYAKENNQQVTREAQNETLVTRVIDTTTEAPKFESKDNLIITKEPNYTDKIYKQRFISKEIITNDIIINSTPKLNSDVSIKCENETIKNISETDKTNKTEDELVFAENNQSTDIITTYVYINSSNTEDFIKEENLTLSTESPSHKNKESSDDIHLEIIDPDGLMNVIFNTLMNDNIDQADKSDKQTTSDNLAVTDKNVAQNVTKAPDVLEINKSENEINEKIMKSSTEIESRDFQRFFSSISNTDINFNTEKYDYIDRSSVENVSTKNSDNISTELDDFLIVSTKETETDFDTTTQNNIDNDLRSDRSEVNLIDISGSDTMATDSEINKNVNNVVINSENIELRSTDSDMSDTATESMDQVVTYIYNS